MVALGRLLSCSVVDQQRSFDCMTRALEGSPFIEAVDWGRGEGAEARVRVSVVFV